MARFHPKRDISPLLRAAEVWRDRCLIDNGSLFDPKARVWTEENALELRQDFTQRPNVGEGDFLSKLHEQLDRTSKAGKQLAAEMLWALMLFQSNMGPPRKREVVATIWSWSDARLDGSSEFLTDEVLGGVGSPGMAYNSYRWKEFAYLIELTIQLKQQPTEQRRQLLADPWRFGEWVQSLAVEGGRQFPNILRYLLYPDTYERITVDVQKRKIVAAFAPHSAGALEAMNDVQLDQELAALRANIAAERGTPNFDFYDEELAAIWRPPAAAWLLSWNPANWPWPSFQRDRASTAAGTPVRHQWRCSNKAAEVGDPVYLMRTGAAPRGIIARGRVIRAPYRDRHYSPERAALGEQTLFIDVSFEDIRDPARDPFLTVEDLRERVSADQHWSPQGSGIAISSDAAEALELVWQQLAPVEVGEAAMNEEVGVFATLMRRLLEEFAAARATPFKEVPSLWSAAEALRNHLAGSEAIRSRPHLLVKWSLGKGVWAKVPWIAILNRNATTTTQEGLYCVFLLSEGLTRVYLTLNQGMTALVRELGQAGAVNVMESRAADYRRRLPELAASGFTLSNDIDLETEGWRSKNYEVGTVAYLELPATHLPPDAELEAQLEALLSAYDRLVNDVTSSPAADENDAATDPPATAEPYTVADAMAELFVDQAEFERILSVWEAKKNLVLQGAPGVGKSFIARRLAYALIGAKDDSRVGAVQFHQSYGYEDFVQGYRPTDEGGFALKDGVFFRFCQSARADPTRRYVFIIDEINRGNLSKIFGEMMLLIEHDKRSREWAVRLAYARPDEPPFYLPENLFVIGMMNTADRSLSLVDYALRRRFAFITLEPAFSSPAFQAYLVERGIASELVSRIVEGMTELNGAIADDKINLGPGFRIGHSFFVPPKAFAYFDGWFEQVVETEIRPLLDEYWFDDAAKAAQWRERLVNGGS